MSDRSNLMSCSILGHITKNSWTAGGFSVGSEVASLTGWSFEHRQSAPQ
jgi:hypothetical protein